MLLCVLKMLLYLQSKPTHNPFVLILGEAEQEGSQEEATQGEDDEDEGHVTRNGKLSNQK